MAVSNYHKRQLKLKSDIKCKNYFNISIKLEMERPNSQNKCDITERVSLLQVCHVCAVYACCASFGLSQLLLPFSSHHSFLGGSRNPMSKELLDLSSNIFCHLFVLCVISVN